METKIFWATLISQVANGRVITLFDTYSQDVVFITSVSSSIKWPWTSHSRLGYLEQLVRTLLTHHQLVCWTEGGADTAIFRKKKTIETDYMQVLIIIAADSKGDKPMAVIIITLLFSHSYKTPSLILSKWTFPHLKSYSLMKTSCTHISAEEFSRVRFGQVKIVYSDSACQLPRRHSDLERVPLTVSQKNLKFNGEKMYRKKINRFTLDSSKVGIIYPL